MLQLSTYKKHVRLITVCILNGMLLPFALKAQNNTNSLEMVKPDTTNQTDLIDIAKSLFHIKPTDTTGKMHRKVFFSFLPTTSSIAGGGRALVTSTNAAFYLGNKSNTSLSSATFVPYVTFDGRFGLTLKSNVWTKQNAFNYLGDARFLYYPQYTWGFGGNTNEDDKILAKYNYIRFYNSVLKGIGKNIFVGLGYDLDYHYNISSEFDSLPLNDFVKYDYGTQTGRSTVSSGLAVNLLYDTRNNPANPLPGYYANIIYRVNPKFMGSTENWQSLYFDFRKYISLTQVKDRQNILAFWSYYWTALNNNVPYFDLPSIGWDPVQQRSGRGIEQNRYRGKGMLYFESEYRRDITNNGLLGFALFANVNSVTEQDRYTFKYWHPAAGFGLRVKFNKTSRTNVTLDYAFSKYYSGLYLNLGETF